MKFSFVVSLVAFVILFVAVTVLYGVLSGLGVFDSLQRVVNSVTSSQSSAGVNAKAWFSASKVLGYTALLGSLNIVLITAMSTIGSVIYNLTSRLVGGVEVTLRETELPSRPNHGATRPARAVGCFSLVFPQVRPVGMGL
jgi:MFS superfamily sulfate permease-like transporter